MASSFSRTINRAIELLPNPSYSFERLSGYLRKLTLFLYRLSAFHRATELLPNPSYSFERLSGYLRNLTLFLYRLSAFHLTPFVTHLCYFLSLAFLGSLLLTFLNPGNPSLHLRYVDMLFMSTSALTVSSLATVEMEDLSSAQIAVLTLLMLVGGEVFTNLFALFPRRVKQSNKVDTADAIESAITDFDAEFKDLRSNCVRFLGFVVAGYVAVFHFLGTVSILAYFVGVSRARSVLEAKGINLILFCFSTVVSSFANAGFIATNENMMVFNRDPVLLLLVIGLVLAGDTMFPLLLRWAIWGLNKVTKRKEFGYMLKNSGDECLRPLLPSAETWALSATVIGLFAALLALLCAVDWYGPVFDGLSPIHKLVSALFITVNSRHAGETSMDCSVLSPAVLVFLVVMMYLPSSTSFSLTEEQHDSSSDGTKKTHSMLQKLLFSQLSCVVIFVAAVCLSERRKMATDPLNFSTLNMIFEVTSGYGNVGLSTGYSCWRLLKLDPEASCEAKSYSLSGWWSDEGKLVLVFVMLYGRLKKFSGGCGKAWKLY